MPCDHELQCCPLPRLPWLSSAIGGGLLPGANYLLSGPPGCNKTTLCVQIAIEAANQGRDVVLLINEQRPTDLASMFARIEACELVDLPDAILNHVFLEEFGDAADLLRLFHSSILKDHRDAALLIVDSLHGGSMSTICPSGYRSYAKFADAVRKRGISMITVTHVTKAGRIAGPRSLEHKVDVCLFIERAACFRHFFVTKNRYGAEMLDPVVLESHPIGLLPSRHQAGNSSSVLGYIGEGDQLTEVQAMVALPRYGGRPELNAPFLPARRVKQIIATLNSIPGLCLSEISYVINALVPDLQVYNPAVDLTLTIALLATYLQQAVPEDSLFIGGLDLHRHVRPVGMDFLTALSRLLRDGQHRPIRRVYLSSSSAGLFAELLRGHPTNEDGIQIVGVRDLDELIGLIWPGAVAGLQPHN